MCRLNLYISFILQIHYSKLTFELIMKSEKIGEAKRKVELRMVAISSDSQNICEGPNQRQAFFFIAHICTSRASNPGLYRGRVLFYHQTTGAGFLDVNFKPFRISDLNYSHLCCYLQMLFCCLFLGISMLRLLVKQYCTHA